MNARIASKIAAFTVSASLLVTCFVGCTAETASSDATAGQTGDASVSGTADGHATGAVHIELQSPSQQDPVTVGMGVSKHDVAPGEQVLLVVRAQIADGWHIYAAQGPTGVGIPTDMKFTMPAGVTTAGEWTMPAKETKSSDQGEVGSYHGVIEFSVPIAVSADAPAGPAAIQCEFGYQACTETQCMRPMKTPLSVPLNIQGSTNP